MRKFGLPLDVVVALGLFYRFSACHGLRLDTPLQPTPLAEERLDKNPGWTEITNPDADELLASWKEYVSKTGFNTTKRGVKAGFGESDGLWFYHCAKAGTSFQQTLFKYACPRLPASTDNNSKLTYDLLGSGMPVNSPCGEFVHRESCDMQVGNPNWECPYKQQFAGRAAGMIRDPLKRALSGYFFGPCHVGIGSDVGEDPGKGGKFSDKTLAEINNSPTPFLTYANSTRIKGCQVRMLIGRGCGEYYTPTPADVAEAIRVMKNEFLFVGITEDWAKSIFLFHGLFVGIPTKSEFHNMRKTNKEDEKEVEAMQQVQAAAWDDPYDGPLFREATKHVNAQFSLLFGPGCELEPDMAFCRYFKK